MAANEADNLTQLLHAIARGDSAAPEQLFQRVYDDLRRLARQQMSQERAGHTLGPTALVHEAYLRLFPREGPRLEASDRRYFFRAAAEAMRRILIEHARTRHALKRGGGQQRIPLDDVVDHLEEQLSGLSLELLALDDSLTRLQGLNQRQHDVVQLRFFGGHSLPVIADLLGVSLGTVEKDQRHALAFLRSQLT